MAAWPTCPRGRCDIARHMHTHARAHCRWPLGRSRGGGGPPREKNTSTKPTRSPHCRSLARSPRPSPPARQRPAGGRREGWRSGHRPRPPFGVWACACGRVRGGKREIMKLSPPPTSPAWREREKRRRKMRVYAFYTMSRRPPPRARALRRPRMAGEGGSRNQRGQGARGAAHAPLPPQQRPVIFLGFQQSVRLGRRRKKSRRPVATTTLRAPPPPRAWPPAWERQRGARISLWAPAWPSPRPRQG